jgi:hypothetical protein
MARWVDIVMLRCYDDPMRTTINLDEDVLRAVRSLARERRESLGDVVSALIREALRPSETTTYEAGFPVFQVREGAPPITPDVVESALEDA